ncbi:SXP/RAL-2 family protein Ani s 5-like cation-binding domain-containing protein [Caenorhabditis elegans]|uniref:SXP/RAL-2 family protein Ani s 5-like cation-binding domain-containing protein n=1 Tax=Caenorhabditis elegans TaxID=6239 RepID=G5EBS0_CAEEL|nr:SXP/RAL-2 family protein Ani s 5-like cation-binding domain-containing protein [Caenorhabditis elegans]NP_502473.1 SXP/RAL-2 family protein Ani s 5-like cation-binding domain-containing protein [Caenorhabditis elegans]CAB05134.1 SXP/RAL-2 family protein Ani s 5-like cation-binding domain-containing protein [Caenorhabditis elegans]CAB05137.1 SXP/RAL-2 family protein Ani s 5-like cation-binding domain-containing protein [Caenorhabditis elegans]|eukprot:NP_502470.1 Uncharacterized protein CELE_C32H11.8 [Caenorhabditis elegans]
MLFYLLSAIIFTIVASAAPTSAPALTVDEAGEAVFQNLTEKAIFGFLQIDSDPTLTIAEIDQKGAEWAEKHGIADKWAVFYSTWQAREEKFNKIKTTVFERLPSTYKKLSEIIANKNQTLSQVGAAIQELDEKFNLEVQLIFILSKILRLNEKIVMNGGLNEVGNEATGNSFRRMRDFKERNINVKDLMIPGPKL